MALWSLGLSPEELARREEEQARRAAEQAAFDALPRVEQNAIKLAALESEWTTLGPLRSITFTVSFAEEHEANSFAKSAKEQGFDVNVERWIDNYREYKMEATRMIEPHSEIVTYWEKWFQTKATAVPRPHDDGYFDVGAEFEGWSYPKRLSPAFLLEGDERSRRYQYIEGAKDRTRILFGQAVCDFEASNGWASKKSPSKSSSTFELVPSEFLETANRRRPYHPEATASAFSHWLYSLYGTNFGSAQDQEEGRIAEEHIFLERRKAYSATDFNTMRREFPDWRLQFNGLHINKSDQPIYYEIPDLNVRGEPLRALPDLIYENRRTGEILIVEIKYSQTDIPRNLWPNIWGQLWCYSQIVEFRDAPKVTVIGEVWGGKSYSRGGGRYVYLRASVRRNPRAIPFDRFFRSLFNIYCSGR